MKSKNKHFSVLIHGFQFRGESVHPARCIDAFTALAVWLFLGLHLWLITLLRELLKNQGNQINCTDANIQAVVPEQSVEQQALPLWTRARQHFIDCFIVPT